jgi:hypothetical protein
LNTTFANFLTTCQIYKAKFGFVLLVLAKERTVHKQDRVRARGSVIGKRRGYFAVTVAETNELHDLLELVDSHLHHAFQ